MEARFEGDELTKVVIREIQIKRGKDGKATGAVSTPILPEPSEEVDE